MSSPDVVFCVREHTRRMELQYALRSWALVPHGKVWFVGGLPDWVRNVEHVPFPDGKDKWRGISDKARFLPTIEGLSESFYYTEDDYFILREWDEIPAFTRPEVSLNSYVEHFERRKKRLTGWSKYMGDTRDALHAGGILDPLSFDVHIPMLWTKSGMPLELDTGEALSWRSMYGNVSDAEPVPVSTDVKAPGAAHLKKVLAADVGFLSSSEGSFKRSGCEAFLEGLFPDPSPYEKEFYVDEVESPEQVESPEPVEKPKVVARKVRTNRPNLVKLETGEWIEEKDY